MRSGRETVDTTLCAQICEETPLHHHQTVGLICEGQLIMTVKDGEQEAHPVD